jgi:hypothetical protein
MIQDSFPWGFVGQDLARYTMPLSMSSNSNSIYIREGLDHPKRLAYNIISLTKTSTYIRGV